MGCKSQTKVDCVKFWWMDLNCGIQQLRPFEDPNIMVVTTQSTMNYFIFLLCNHAQYNSVYKNPIQMHSFTSESVQLMIHYTDRHTLEKILICEGGAVGLQLSLCVYSFSHDKWIYASCAATHFPLQPGLRNAEGISWTLNNMKLSLN